MEHRLLGRSGLRVPVLGFGAGTFGGRGPLFSAWGNTDQDDARRLIALCLDHGVSLFDTADVYSDGASEEILGAALAGRRHRAMLSAKVTLRTGDGPNDAGWSRHHLIQATEATLKRLNTDHIDILQLHAFDAATPVDQMLRTLDDLVRAGKVRAIGASNFAGWQLMKALAAADRLGTERLVANQTYYSLIGRDYEWDLMPLGLDQGGRPGLEPAGLGSAYGPHSTRPAATGQQPPARDRSLRPASRRRTPVPRGGRTGRGGRRNRPQRAADRAELAAAAPHRQQCVDRRAQ